MATFTIDQPLKAVTGGNTTDNELAFGSFGQQKKLVVQLHVIAGPIAFAVNEAAAVALGPVAAGSKIELVIKDSDVIHFDQTASGDYFLVATRDFVD